MWVYFTKYVWQLKSLHQLLYFILFFAQSRFGFTKNRFELHQHTLDPFNKLWISTIAFYGVLIDHFWVLIKFSHVDNGTNSKSTLSLTFPNFDDKPPKGPDVTACQLNHESWQASRMIEKSGLGQLGCRTSLALHLWVGLLYLPLYLLFFIAQFIQ